MLPGKIKKFSIFYSIQIFFTQLLSKGLQDYFGLHSTTIASIPAQ
jgi:hypothetical protein